MAKSLPPLPCSCATLRRAARAVTQLYDEELRASGLRGTQFTLLQALEAADGLSQKQLASILCLDSTTLTRSLRPLENEGLIKTRAGSDRRERILSLTPRGRKKIEQTLPHWNRAQRRLKEAVGADLPEIEQGLHRVAEAVS